MSDRTLYSAELTRPAAADYLDQLAANIASSQITIRSPKGAVTLPIGRVARCRLSATESAGVCRIRMEIAACPVPEALDEDLLIF